MKLTGLAGRLAAQREKLASGLRLLTFGSDDLAAGPHAPLVDAETGLCVLDGLPTDHPCHGAAGRATAAALRKADGLAAERSGWR